MTLPPQGGGGLLLSSHPPYAPLSANAINSITKNLLAEHGVPMSVFGAHSTRGAGVAYYKKLGLSSEHVAELGQWKNVAAFNAHYLRLNAAEVVQHKFLLDSVHNISPVEGAEPEGSCTPRKNDIGGSDPEGEAPKTGEILPFVAGCFVVFVSFLVPGAFLTAGCRSWRVVGLWTPAVRGVLQKKTPKRKKRN